MMKKTFWDDPYQTKLTTTVSALNDNKVLLAETIIFSFSGGQESDEATINGLPVLGSEMIGFDIMYELPDNHGLSVGDSVQCHIDWDRRYALMRLHFAAELILELVTRQLGVEKIGAHIAQHKARIDFYYEHNIAQHFEALLTEYQAIIAMDLVIRKGYISVEQQRRYWEIDNFAKVPCGGTHVRSTKEVGYIKLKRKNIGGGKERIEISLLNKAQA